MYVTKMLKMYNESVVFIVWIYRIKIKLLTYKHCIIEVKSLINQRINLSKTINTMINKIKNIF